MCELCEKVITGQAKFHAQFFENTDIFAIPVKYCPCCGQCLERAKTIESERYAIAPKTKGDKK